MASESMRTHRDSLAIVLAILGGALWLAVPCIVWLDRDTATKVAIVAGAGIGAASCAVAVRSLSWVTAAVGGAVAALIILGLRSLDGHHAVTAGAAGVALAAAAIAALAAVAAPRAIATTHSSIAAALVSSAAIGVLALAIAPFLPARGDSEIGVAVTMFGAPIASGAITAVVLPGTTPASLAFGWFVLLASSAVIAAAVAQSAVVLLLALAGGFGLLVFAGGFGALGASLALRYLASRQPPPPAIPPARVVE